MQSGTVVLIRHALAPGTGDPPGFKLEQCSTQRNLNEEGRAQAKALGDAFRAKGIAVAQVWHSQWCRTTDTANLAFKGMAPLKPEAAFNSFLSQPERRVPQTEQAKKLLQAWRGPGVLVVVTHQVSISEISGIFTNVGEMVVMQPSAGGLTLLAQGTP